MSNMVRAIVLAAGKGTRMKSDLPKVLHKINNKTMLGHVLGNLTEAGISMPVVVVGHQAERVKKEIAEEGFSNLDFCLQAEQKGTGHAVLMAEDALANFDGPVLIASGDVPLLRPSTFQALLKPLTDGNDTVLTVLSMDLADPARYGRIIRDAQGNLARIVEYKDASETERAVSEVNAGTYAVRSRELFAALKQIKNDNAAGEYYLPDIIEIFKQENKTVSVVQLTEPSESLGVNTQEELKNLEKILNERSN